MHPATVLIVNQTPGGRAAHREALARSGLNVCEVFDDRAAHDVLDSEPVQLVLLDLNRIDGRLVGFLKELRERPGGAALSIVALVTPLIDGGAGRIEHIDVTDYLVKPVNPDRLVEFVRRYLPLGGPNL